MRWSQTVLATALLAVLAASPGSVRIAAPTLNMVGVKSDLAGFYSDHLAQRLSAEGLFVISAADIKAVLTQERQKQLLGCADDKADSCAVEMGNALGADAVLSGTVAKIEDVYQVDLKVVSAVNAKPLALYSGRAQGDKALLDELDKAAKKLADQLKAAPLPARPSTWTASFRPGEEKRTGRLITRDDPVRATGKRMVIAGLGLMAVGVGVFLIPSPITKLVGGTSFLLGFVAVPVGAIVYALGHEENLTVDAMLVGDRNHVGFALVGHF